jgi:excisionase family DNA binding protein
MTATATQAGPRVLHLRDVCRLFGVNRHTIRRWCKNGTLPKPYRPGRRIYWKAEDIEAAMREMRE